MGAAASRKTRHERRRVEIGFANGWLIRSRGGAVLVDAGFARMEGRVAYALRRMGLRPRDLRLVLVTHAHLDHIGALAAISRHTGAAVAVHRSEADRLRTGEPIMPRGLSTRGRIAVAFGRLVPELVKVEPVAPDVLLSGERDLAEWGLDGRVIETPGHSPGSVSVLLADGTAFVGDVVVSSFRRFLGVRPSVFGQDPEMLKTSWRKLLDAGAQVICPGHGEPFPAEKLARLLPPFNALRTP